MPKSMICRDHRLSINGRYRDVRPGLEAVIELSNQELMLGLTKGINVKLAEGIPQVLADRQLNFTITFRGL